MLPRPGIEDVLEYGRALGLALSQAEARSMQSRMAQHIASFESFHELRIEEDQLPLTATDRDPGYRPTEKDHISVAGIQLSLGSHFMDGYIPDFDASIVTRLLAAGGTIVGKMNMENFSFPG